MTLLWVTEHFVMRRLLKSDNENKCFCIGKLALKPLQIGEIISNNKIMQFSYCYWNTNEKKADNKTTVFHDGICHDCDI